MGERKVLNFYVAPDFDASIIPRQKRDRTKLIEVRTMLPFSMRCNTCGEYMYRGKKFNSRKEDMPGEDYMGIRKFRFYIKCSVCSAEITFCTDPKNSDYECESGALRNFEMWRENDKIIEEDENVRKEEDKIDAMKALENRTLDSKVEMDVLDALDEIQAINQRHEKVDTNSVLDSLFERTAASAADKTLLSSGVTLADELLIKSIKFKQSAVVNKTLPDSDDERDAVPSSSSSQHGGGAKGSDSALNIVGIMQKQMAASSVAADAVPKMLIVKRKAKAVVAAVAGSSSSSSSGIGSEPTSQNEGKKRKTDVDAEPAAVYPAVKASGLGSLMAYGSDDSD
jgi:Saf4/Yju2 protein